MRVQVQRDRFSIASSSSAAVAIRFVDAAEKRPMKFSQFRALNHVEIELEQVVRVGLLFASFCLNGIRPSVDVDSNDLLLYCRADEWRGMKCELHFPSSGYIVPAHLPVCLPACLSACLSIRTSVSLPDHSLAASHLRLAVGTLGDLVDVDSLHPDHFLKKASVEQREATGRRPEQTAGDKLHEKLASLFACLPASQPACTVPCPLSEISNACVHNTYAHLIHRSLIYTLVAER